MSEDQSLHLQHHNQQLKRLVDLSVALNSTLDLDAMLQTIITTAGEVLDCEAASILLYDEIHPRLYFAAATGSDPNKLAEIPVPIEGSLAGTIFRTNHPLILNEAGQDPRHYSLVSDHIQFHVRTLLGVPMHIQERVIGVLEAVNKRSGGFDAQDESVLSVVASHAAIAINNARLMRALQQAFDKVKEADALKSNFLALASHELRTPLGIIIGYASFLREEAKGEISEHAKRVLGAALQMRALVEDMTNLTMLESKGALVKAKTIAIQSVLKTACQEIRELAAARDHKLVFAFQPAPLDVQVDPEKTGSAFVNLLNNAIRFSPPGSQIVVGAADEGDQILAWVQDHGIGIPRGQLQHIFDGFHQGESPNTRHYGGLGIGLTIAKGLIEVQGGKIWAESEGQGQGAVFKVLLPKP
jgi:signal transduction histidine kinase